MNLSGIPIVRTAVFCLLQLLAGIALARDTGTDPSVTIEKEVRSYVVNADGTFVLNYELTLLINEQRAVAASAQRSISYNRTLEDISIVDAYTQKPDGRRVKVQPDQIKDQQEAQSVGAPMFRDTRVSVVIYPEVAVGDRIVLQFRKTRHTALFPGHFEDIQSPPFVTIKQLSVIYDLPATMRLGSDARGYRETAIDAAPGRKRLQWDYQPAERHRIERGSVAYTDYGARLAVSTFADFPAFAQAYEAGARDKGAVTDKVRSQAEKITAGLKEPRDKALALSNWVRRNIRYVAVYVGAGGVVPHAADAVLDNLYGDCKDHVVVLEALLAAVGIDSTPALINLGNSYQLAKVPTLGVLNHVITYVPQLNLYLDSTAGPVAAGYLPALLFDKPVLLTRTGQLARTPAQQPNQIVHRSDYRVRADGAADFSFGSVMRGWPAESTRYIMRSIKVSDREKLVENMLLQRGQKGRGTIDLGRLGSIGDEYRISLNGVSDNLIALPGPVGISTGVTFANDIAMLVGAFSLESERTQDFICISRNYEEETQFAMPAEITVLGLPKPVSIHDAYFNYTSSYARQDQQIVIRRSLEFRHPGAVCAATEFKAMQPALEQIQKDLRSQIVVQGS